MNDPISKELGEIQSHLIGGIPPSPHETRVDDAPIICLPPGWTLQDRSDLLDVPRRISATQVFCDLMSWIDYVNRFKQDGNSVVFLTATKRALKATATIDYHAPHGSAAWCLHTAVFNTTETPAWQAWAAQDDKIMKQSDFADFLYRNQKEILTGADAELLEIIQTLKATAAGEFREMRDDHSGSAELIYRMKVSAQGGTAERPLTLPNHFDVVISPFYGCPAMSLQADLRVRTPVNDGDPLLLGFRFYRLEDELQSLADSIVTQIRDKTGLPVWR